MLFRFDCSQKAQLIVTSIYYSTILNLFCFIDLLQINLSDVLYFKKIIMLIVLKILRVSLIDSYINHYYNIWLRQCIWQKTKLREAYLWLNERAEPSEQLVHHAAKALCVACYIAYTRWFQFQQLFSLPNVYTSVTNGGVYNKNFQFQVYSVSYQNKSIPLPFLLYIFLSVLYTHGLFFNFN